MATPNTPPKSLKNGSVSKKFLVQYPTQSPYLNPIEDLWSIVKRRLEQYRSASINLDELWQWIHYEFSNIQKEIIENLAETVPINKVLHNKSFGVNIKNTHILQNFVMVQNWVHPSFCSFWLFFFFLEFDDFRFEFYIILLCAKY